MIDKSEEAEDPWYNDESNHMQVCEYNLAWKSGHVNNVYSIPCWRKLQCIYIHIFTGAVTATTGRYARRSKTVRQISRSQWKMLPRGEHGNYTVIMEKMRVDTFPFLHGIQKLSMYAFLFICSLYGGIQFPGTPLESTPSHLLRKFSDRWILIALIL